jgi:hypothetical protein
MWSQGLITYHLARSFERLGLGLECLGLSFEAETPSLPGSKTTITLKHLVASMKERKMYISNTVNTKRMAIGKAGHRA